MSFPLGRDGAAHLDRENPVRIVGLTTAVAIALTVGLLLFAGSALAAPPGLNWGTEVNAGSCDTTGSPVVNVTHKVVNSVDSGLAGYWASEDYNRRIQLWDQGEGVYCAVVSYQGHFTGVAGQQSPGNAEPLDGDEGGAFEGGYRMTITGVLSAAPAWPIRGQIGAIDYECTVPVGFVVSCPGQVNWIDQYFESGYARKYEWWGWIYHGGRYGTWVNSSDGNSGDIA